MSLPLTETYILRDPGNVGSVQAQGASMFYHAHVLIGLTVHPQVLVSQIWNAIIISMYYGRRSLRAPPFFVAQTDNFGDKGFKGSFRVFPPALPEALPVDAMPDYKKILFSLWEIIKESDINTCVTLLEYSKQLHGLEWENFIRDTKILAQELEMYDGALRAAPK
ncbi:hypothetical protein EDB85DRAFT_2152379 [Lactarius pseudohatsudake]|nr:hypothetical protein EDB85DRAFT_2156336 [Lactarius pseudohatsudake]KAH9021476.1 hypothetical protein EDB85DRAFT_2152379 [Lactarius pseudohatsudake]